MNRNSGRASFNYNLLCVIWLSSGMAMILQYLSGKMGIATEQSLAGIIRTMLKKIIYNTLLDFR